jgi:hypothetical protein
MVTQRNCAVCNDIIYGWYRQESGDWQISTDRGTRPNALYCSDACRQKAYRDRRRRHGLSLQLDEDTDTALRRIADAAGTTRQSLVLDLIRDFVSGQGEEIPADRPENR